MITLVHGPAELLRSEALAEIRNAIAEDPAFVELNTTVLDGRRISLADLQFACGALPFLADRRLVVVEGLLRRRGASSRLSKRTDDERRATDESGEGTEGQPAPQTKALVSYLDQVPETTHLVFVEEDLLPGGPVLRRLVELQRAGQAQILVCARPKKGELPGWIRERARQRKVALDAAAVTDLAEFVGDDLRQLDQELIKLRDYGAVQGRAVTRADVRLLVAATRTANVFDLVEALGFGNASLAGRLLQHSLDVDGEQPLRLLALIGRQYRQLVQVKALQARGAKASEVAGALGLPDWVARKLLDQAKSHSFIRLERALEHILATDEAIKTGQLSDREAMDVLLAELAQR